VSQKTKPHESPLVMTIPLIVLGILSIIGGWIGIPHIISSVLPGHVSNVLGIWLDPVMATVPGLVEPSHALEWTFMGMSLLLSGLSAWSAFYIYVKRPGIIENIVGKIKRAHKLAYNKFYVDELYEMTLIKPIVELAKKVWVHVDVKVIDKATYKVSEIVLETGGHLRRVQTGNLQQYALYMVVGIIAILLII